MTKIEDMKYKGEYPPRPRNRIEEAMKPREISNDQFPIINKGPILSEPVKIENSLKTRKLKIVKLVALALLACLLALSSYYIYRHFVEARAQTPEAVIGAVGKLVVLPVDETPEIATVSDLAPLKGQPFFADAVIGDKVLIFQKSKKAILYRPSTNKIIIVAPIK